MFEIAGFAVKEGLGDMADDLNDPGLIGMAGDAEREAVTHMLT